MTPFAALHRPGDPLLLPNVWDVAGARALAAAGFAAVGTTSLGVAASHGLPDGEDAAVPETLRLVARLAPLGLHVSADIERGSVAAAVTAAEAGAVGVNVEDAMCDPEVHAALIRGVKREAPELFVNARTDTHWLRPGDLPEALRRARRYQDAGADGIFVPGVSDASEISALVEALDVPLNVLAQAGGPVLPELAGLGVARVSMGSLLFRAALAAAVETAEAVRRAEPVRAGLPSYQDVNG
ncbi:isocitrate lyase/phosphoenolpyruvate mutase family protein [Dactylosporangium sp. NPDC048998]|uniref:isocitrate lyase/PEP mutase family protein n=1 Tax=Dactylosporangium sp. NPDC048998 TaxID=3363976 RepID=UPI00371574E7